MAAYVNEYGYLFDGDDIIIGFSSCLYENKSGELKDVVIFVTIYNHPTREEFSRILKDDVVIIPDLSLN
jgi:hypothetical protein